MKNLLVFIGFALLTRRLQAAPSPQDSALLESWPPQTVCPNLKALPFKSASSPAAMTFTLFVGKIKTSSPISITDNLEVGNWCSPLTYADECKGSQTLVEIKSDGTKTVKTASYNEATKNVVCSEQSFILDDPNYHVFRGVINKLSVIDEYGTVTEVTNIPKSVSDLQNKQVVTLAYGPNLSYGVYATCDESAVWVAYAGSIVSSNRIKEYEDMVKQTLLKLGYEPSSFSDVPFEIPVDVNPCLHLREINTIQTKTESNSDSSESNSSGN